MNADPTDTTRFPHLDLDDLIAEASGQSAGVGARAHLAACAQCRLEADRWARVADGVRSLAADAIEPELAEPELGASRRPRSRSSRRTWWAAGSAAAALLLLAGLGEATGALHVSVGARSGGSGSSDAASFTTVTGCPQIQSANGTLERVNGGDLVVKTRGGQTITMTTTAATFIGESGSAGPPSSLAGAITDGARVYAAGSRARGGIHARAVGVGLSATQVAQSRSGPATGTVADARAGGFTLVTPSGSRIPVTVSAHTLITVMHAQPGRLPTGAAIFAYGRAGSNRTLAAGGVMAVTWSPPGEPRLSGIRPAVKNCSSASVDRAILALATGA